MQNLVGIYIGVSILAFIVTSFQNYELFENYFASALVYYSCVNTNIIFYNFCLSMMVLTYQAVVNLIFVQMKEIEKIKIIQKIKFRILDVLFIVFMDINHFSFYEFIIVLCVCLFYIIHNLTIIRSEYLINTHNATLKQHYKLLCFYLILLFVDYSILKNTLLWFIEHPGTSLVFLYYILYITLAIIEPLIVFVIHVYERFSLYQFENLNYHLSIINLMINLPRLTILIILGLFIAFEYVFTVWFLLSLIQNIIDMIQAIKGFKNMSFLTKSIQHLPKADQQLLKNQDDICMVCFREMEEGRVLPCKHIFHSECLRQWIQKNSNNICPKCKRTFDFGIPKPKNDIIHIVNNNNMNIDNMNNLNNLNNNNQINDHINQNNINTNNENHVNMIKNEFLPNNQMNHNFIQNNFQNQKLFKVNQQIQENITLNSASKQQKYIGSLPFCLPVQACYYRKLQDFKNRFAIKSFNIKITETLQFSPKLQMILLDED